MHNGMGTSSGLRPGSMMRPGSQRPGTNMMQAPGVGNSLQHTLSVNVDAPIAREGVRAVSRAGVGTSAGPGRQVVDRSYYIGLLRPKIAELSAEIERLSEQEQLIERSDGVLAQLQQRAKTVTDNITKLKGTLADVNLALENSTSRDTKAVKEQCAQLEKKNTEKRKEVDNLFLAVKDAEGKTQSNMQTLEDEIQQLDKRILSENQDYGLYKATREEAFGVSDMVLSRQHELRTLAAKQELLMAALSNDPDKKRASETLRSILQKRREKDELTKQCALSVEEEKQMLIKQVKTTRSDIEVLDRQVNDTRDTLQESRVRMSSLDDEMKNYSGDNVKAFQELQERDREMQRFVDEYPDLEKEESSKIGEAQQAISQLIARISQALELQRQMPAEGSPNALKALNTEVDAKKDQIKNDQKTHERLEKELLERKTELDKVAHLDRKINEELESHAAQMAEQKDEMIKYGDLEALRLSVETMRKDLVSQKAYLTHVRDGGKAQLNAMTAAYETDQKALQSGDIGSTLQAQEQKLRMLWQSTFTLEDFVRLKEKDTQYLSSKAECLRMVDEINLHLKDPSRIAGLGVTPAFSIQK